MPYRDPHDPRRVASWRRYNETHRDTQRTYREEHADELRVKAAEYQAAHSDERGAYYRSWRQTERGREVRRRASAIERVVSAVQVAARSAVNAAVRQGRLTRKPCEICGAQPTHAHHPFGYESPMDLAVWWLCGGHHRGIHATSKGD